MDVKSLLRESRLIRFIKPGLGGPLIPDSHIKSLKEPLTDAIRTAVLNAFPSKDVKLNIVEAQTMAILYLEELEKTGNEKGLSSIEKYMKISDCSKATATRDLTALLQRRVIYLLDGGGRNTRYEILLD